MQLLERMTMVRRKRIVWAALGSAILLLLGFSMWPRVVVQVHNSGSETLKRVTVCTSGYQYDLGSLEPGETKRVRVDCRGESGVSLSFETSVARLPRQDVGGYFEGSGYTGKLRVEASESGVQSVEDDINIWPSWPHFHEFL